MIPTYPMVGANQGMDHGRSVGLKLLKLQLCEYFVSKSQLRATWTAGNIPNHW